MPKQRQQQMPRIPIPKSKRQRITWGITLLTLIALGLLLAWRWQAWFGNKPEPPYHTAERIDRITITPGENFSSERNISWRCGETLAQSYIEYGIAGIDTNIIDRQYIPAQGTSITTRGGKGCFYGVRLRALQAGETYRYKVHTGTQSSGPYTFSIPECHEQTDFIYIGDVQDPSGILSDSLLPQLQEALPRLDFLAAAGDQIEGPSDQYWDVWYKSLGTWSPELCIIAATGNHEYLKKGLRRELDPRWIAQYLYPQNGPKDFEGRSYYVDFPLMRFIVMDSNGITSPMDILRHRSWLRESLDTSIQPWQVVMFHHGIYSVRDGRSNPIMRYGFKSILEDHGADLVLQGHDHAYSRITSRSIEGDSIPPMYVISSSSPKVYRNGFDEVHDRLGSGLQLYQHISLSAQSLRYTSYLYNGDVYDDVEMTQGKGMDETIRITDYAREIPERFIFDAFGTDKKGQKKAHKYQQEVKRYLEDKHKH